MFDLFVTSDITRRAIRKSVEFDTTSATRKAQKRQRRRGFRSASATVLRGLAERLEPSPSA